ncbi:MAG: ubiquinol-cytochrome c reductase iron-sulfur subunit [Ignavibacteria bacterium]|nr:ubiquinol-cytochrome c reductase iron-sulfur subunit [Ignavibacteria bacterium]
MKLLRRDFLNKLGLASVAALLAGHVFTWVRSLFPNVTYGQLRRVKIGHPHEIPEGIMFFNDLKLYVYRDRETFHAISAVCTHLGCTVNHTKLARPKTVEIEGKSVVIDSEFHCPCHGSKFYGDGMNYEGPAPRPLEWVRLEIAPEDGKLVADLDQRVERNSKLTV